MDRNCLSIGFGLFPDSHWRCDITCTDLSKDGSLLATGTQQGYVALWKLRDRRQVPLRRPVSLQSFKQHYERTTDISVEPYLLFVANNNPISCPVSQVAFASGSRPMHALQSDRTHTTSIYCSVEDAEEVLVSLHKDNSVAVWSLTDCRCLHKVKGPPFAIQRMCVFPDDRFIALVGRTKINVIDLWRLKLIGTLELNGTCHFDKAIYSSIPQVSYKDSSSPELSMECAETSTFNVSAPNTPLNASVKKACYILRAHCGPAPFSDPYEVHDTTPDFRHKAGKSDDHKTELTIRCPLLLTALLDNNEMVIWDLTAPILSYKRKYGASNGSVTVVTQWDRRREHSANHPPLHGIDGSHHILSSRAMPSTVGHGDANADFPMLRDKIPDLQDATGDICIVDRYIFVMLGIYIFVWYYDHDGALVRVAEIPNMDMDGTLSNYHWQGFECLRLSSTTILLFAWLNNGRVSVFLFPNNKESKKHFRPLTMERFPEFGDITHLNETIHIYMRKNSDPGYSLDVENGNNALRFCMIRHTSNGYLSIGMCRRTEWSFINTASLIAACFSSPKGGILNSSFFYTNGSIQRIDVLSCGYIRSMDVISGDTRALISFRSIEGCLSHLFRGCRMRPLVLPGNKVQEWVSTFPSEGASPSSLRIKSALIHCLGFSYLVLCIESYDILVYTLSSFALTAAFCHLHVAPIRAIYGVFSINCRGSNTSDTVMYEIDDTFATIDADGFLVLVQLSLLLDDLSEETPQPDIHESCIYSESENTSVPPSPRPEVASVKYFESTSSERRGIHRMQRSIQLLSCEIDRVAVNLEKDLLYVLTHHSILLWRISSGTFLRALPYLETYRKTVVSSNTTPADDRKPYVLSTIADTLTSLLTTDWQSTIASATVECTYQRYLDHCTPHDMLSPCMFQDKYFKKRLSASLHMSFLRMHFSPSPSSDADVYMSQSHMDPHTLHPAARLVKLHRRRKGSYYVSIKWRTIENASMGLQINRRDRVMLDLRRFRYFTYDDRDISTLSHSIPVLIFPLQEILPNLRSEGSTLLSKLSASSTLCYLGVPSGTFSIPLYSIKNPSRFAKHITEPYLDYHFCFKDDYLRKEMAHPSIRRSLSFSCLFDERKVLHQSRLSLLSSSNAYLSTCMLLRDFVITSKVRSSATFWLRSIDVWLLMRLLVDCTCKETYAALSNELIIALRYLSPQELHLHVSRAITLLCPINIQGASGRNFVTLCVCPCQGTTFSFGKRCGVCSQHCAIMDTSGLSPPGRPHSWEEDASLLLLVVVTMDQRLSAFCDFVYFDHHLQPFVSYVSQLMFRHMLSVEDHVRPGHEHSHLHRIFNLRNYCVEMFDRGFASVWTLQLLDNSGIPISLFSKSRVHSLARSFYKSDSERAPSTQFVLSALSLYRATKSEHWLSILRKCFLLDTPMMIRIVRWIVRERRLDKWYIETSVKLLIEFVTEIREGAIQHLPDVVVIVVRCLDPSDSSIRLLMLKPATSALFHLVKNFPMVAFYQNTQRFAVGSVTGHVVIYDLRTATKCRTLVGGMSNVASLAFSSTGDYIAAYYMDPPCLVIWNCSSSGLLGSLLHSSKKEHKIIRLKPVEVNPSTTAMDIKIQSKSNREWFLHREDGRGYMISI
ncbi:WD G-beta repeat-containing protein protein, putative [Babesia ovis]|uniref:WD G-beta repeat-containing protein protein, putative n=1 Tax=Babesia ovis TaxID=5869 RepID=A0A9W5TC02_BABOV|nr:WD G-beta repeat-containing protein protein, putative [Babesia ovis]